jgi:hypothetical protein
MGKRTEGNKEFCEIVKKFPSNDLANKARVEVKKLGLTCGPVAPVKRRKT